MLRTKHRLNGPQIDGFPPVTQRAGRLMLTQREHFRDGIFQASLPWFLPLAKFKFAAYAHLVSMN
jgi:hypothetical protein